MNIHVLNQDFQTVSIIDTFESFLWTNRYNALGDCEIYSPVTSKILKFAQVDFYLWIEESEHMMIIDERIILSDVESGNKVAIKGSSLESILTYRIIWVQTILSGNFQDAIKKLLDESIINPSIEDRKIPNFIFEYSTDPRITEMTIEAQFTGDNLYDAVKQLCEDRKLGFKIILNDDNQFVFSLYMGIDRSYAQEIIPYVIFSPEFDNIINSNYLESNKTMKTVALIAGEGEGIERKTTTVGSGSGIGRRELFVDARDISSVTYDTMLTEEEYNAQLAQRGSETMADYVFIQTFEGAVETTQMFIFGIHFFLGDIVQIVNEFGIEASTRIVEIIFSTDKEGSNVIPTFSVIPLKGETT